MPSSSAEVLNRAVLQSPAVSASIEAVRAARQAVHALMPSGGMRQGIDDALTNQ